MKLSYAAFAFAAIGSASAFAPPAFSTVRTSALNAGLMIRETGKSSLDPSVIQRYNDLPFPEESVLAEYVWVDADGNTRSKTRTLPAKKVS
jgi:glutamine synthetase